MYGLRANVIHTIVSQFDPSIPSAEPEDSTILIADNKTASRKKLKAGIFNSLSLANEFIFPFHRSGDKCRGRVPVQPNFDKSGGGGAFR